MHCIAKGIGYCLFGSALRIDRRQAPGKGKQTEAAEGRGSGENQRKREAEEETRTKRKAATGEGDEGKAPDAGEVPSLLPRPMGHPHHHRPTQRGTYCQISLSSGSFFLLQFLLALQGSSCMRVDFRCPNISSSSSFDRFFIPSILAYLFNLYRSCSYMGSSGTTMGER